MKFSDILNTAFANRHGNEFVTDNNLAYVKPVVSVC